MTAKAETLDAPGHEAARDAVEAGLGAGAMVSVFGRCEVEYEGRASSYLGPGDRLVVLKPDGTLLVHTGEQRTPVNWQPPGCEHAASLRGGRLALGSTRETPAETIDVTFDAVHSVSRYRLDDPEELELSGTEADLRERVLAEPSLVEDGFEPAATERATTAGAADVVGTDADGRTTVVELKRRRVGPDAVGQLRRYVDALRREAATAEAADTETGVEAGSEVGGVDASDAGKARSDGGGEVRGILVAPSVTDRARRLLDEEGLEFRSLAP
jgi:RecB family endonuclease NucS